MRVELKLTGIDGVIDTLKSLPAEVVSKRGGPAKAALRKGAVLIQKEELTRLRAAIAHVAEGGKAESIGLLEKSVIVTRGKPPTGGNGERYLVRVKRRTYPGRKGSKPVTTLKTAQLLEYGSRQQPAEPWIRPAVQAKGEEAVRLIETELVKGIDRVVKKLAAQNRGR